MSTLKTVLVVEDDPTIRSSLHLVLEANGYNVQTAGNGLEALEMLRKGSLPNLILLDMRMPIMDGWAFARAFRKEFESKIPIVVMTAASDAAERAKDIEANAWLGKPFNLSDLRGVIEKQIA